MRRPARLALPVAAIALARPRSRPGPRRRGDELLVHPQHRRARGRLRHHDPGPSDDVLHPSSGDGELAGGAGIDQIQFLGLPAVRVDLRVTDPQVTGRGAKLISEIENVVGTLAADTPIGDGEPNVLEGFDAGDTIDGGADHDRLAGDGGDDRVRGYTGVDALFGDAGADLMFARDPKPILDGKLKGDRRIDCGPGAARASVPRSTRRISSRARVDRGGPMAG